MYLLQTFLLVIWNNSGSVGSSWKALGRRFDLVDRGLFLQERKPKIEVDRAFRIYSEFHVVL